jgi:hypothetical protein
MVCLIANPLLPAHMGGKWLDTLEESIIHPMDSIGSGCFRRLAALMVAAMVWGSWRLL